MVAAEVMVVQPAHCHSMCWRKLKLAVPSLLSAAATAAADAAMVRVSGSLQKSVDVMKLVNDTLKLPELQRTMMEMSKGV